MMRAETTGAAGLGRGGRMSRQRKRDAVLRLLRGEDRRWCSEASGLGQIAHPRLGRYACGHAVQAECCPSSPHPTGPLPRPELAGVRGRAEAARRPDAVAGRDRHGHMASPAPDHTTLSRRSRDFAGRRPKTVPHGPVHLVIDSTGLKLFGQGEWDEEKHGRARRSWRKLHIAVDADTGEIAAAC